MSASQITTRTTMKALAGLAGLTLAASALAACGSSSPTHSTAVASAKTSEATPARATPTPSNADVGSAPAQADSGKTKAADGGTRSAVDAGTAGGSSGTSRVPRASHATDRVTRGHHVQHAQSTPSSTRDDPSSAGVRPVNPCTLVTGSEARSITAGAVVGTTEAPLGPTCIYHPARAKSASITMTVEVLKLSQVTQKLAQRSQFTVRRHPAYCGRLGTQMLFVPLANGQVLNVVAPCAVARQFAAVALGRLAA